MRPPAMIERCELHPEKNRVANCFHCMRAVCAVCIRLDGMHDLCTDCFNKVEKKRDRKRTILAIVVVVVLIAAGGWIKAFGNPFRYGSDTFEIWDLQSAVEKEPCHKEKVLTLAEAYLRVSAPREVFPLSDRFFAACGEWPRLRWSRFSAHKRLAEYEKAVEEATKLIDDEPYDHDYWWWRAQANESAGKLEAAADDYRQSLIIEPKLGNIPFNLATVYEKLGRPCDAIWPIEQFLSAHPEHLDNARVRDRLERYYKDPRCAAIRGTGTHSMRFAPNTNVIITDAVIDGVKGRFIIDTGATFVSVTPKFAARAGMDTAPGTTISLQTAGGLRLGKLMHTKRVQLGNVVAHRVEAVVMREDLQGVDGLLGMSFLSRFEVQMDHGKGLLTIAQR